MVAPYHNRMPMMLDPVFAEALVRSAVAQATDMLESYPAGDMHEHRVSSSMNKAGYDGPDCITAI